ncbi:GHKL domain-containing protein [Leptospira langatensis]|uniref:histidine kinase n=1 Tax=Leptospira langatensis TaxID=2484983 RepID=A0A5F1ZN34_9LEPT|nr:sensor histidine kinase [Leptospira langatensis]TGK05112.1 GHKL domain-containing protein [Leptospira langatensis]TGL38248.1 GHKL domain-containing protein [Leptospira langatensis]
MRLRVPVFFLLLLGAILGCSPPHAPYSPKAKQGILDLRDWDLKTSPLVSLDGEWEFFNGLEIPAKTSSKTYIHVPGSWNQFPLPNGEHGGEGTGTYRLTVLLGNPIKDLALQMGDISTAYKIYLNGKLLADNGVVGGTKDSMTPSYKHPIILLDAESKELNFVIEVSNFYHITGGIRKSIFLGPILDIFESKKQEISLGWVVFGATFLMGLYHLILFFMRRVDKSAIWFAFFCIDLSIRGFFTGSVFIYEITQDKYWVYIHKLDLLSFVLALPLFSLFLRSLFPEDFHKHFNTAFVSVGAFFALIVLLTPATEYMWYIQIFQAIVGLIIVFFLVLMIYCIFKKREGAVLFAVGAVFLFLATLNDILNQALIIKTRYIANWGLLSFLFSQTIMLSFRFSNAFVRLEELQRSLEQKVLDRTSQLEEAKHVAEEANSMKDTFISLVTHDLRSPITTIMGILQLIENDYEQLDDMSIKEWLKRAENTSSQSLEMIATLLDLNRLKSGSFPMDNSLIYVFPEVEGVLAKLWAQANSKKLDIRNSIPNDIRMNVDRALFSEIFVNLLSNAIKFCREGDSIEIDFSSKPNAMEFTVKDSGIGIPKEMIPGLFSTEIRSTRLGTNKESGTGLGLPLVYSIISAYHGRISVESQEQKGSKFTFSIPQPLLDLPRLNPA